MSSHTIPFKPKLVFRTKQQPNGTEADVTTVMICDNALLRFGLQQILQGTPFVVTEVASATRPGQLRQLAPKPALVIIEVLQNIGQTLEAIRLARKQSPQARIVALADQFDVSFVRLGREAGVDGFCVAAADPRVLLKSLELVMLGESVMPLGALRSIINEVCHNREQPLQNNAAEPMLSDLTMRKLSAQETKILSCLKEGAPNKLIARRLGVAEATIKVHVKAILRKIGAINRTQAAMWATTHLSLQGRAVQQD
jgi:two-component system nitrate/nitrite response regulator NarL